MSTWECKDLPRQRLEPCGCLPPGFSRLRYFFGKRLTVADFVDEQRYHTGKARFHNLHLHGAGVLCGLKVTTASSSDGLIRVTKGAALDPCGREIVVGFDQCIDVEAWFAAERERQLDDDEGSDWPADHVEGDELRLCVALRYAECPAHPEPAPRDPCACAEGGCDFGRVSEGFELRLFVDGDPSAPVEHDLFPTRDDIADVLADSVAGVDILRRLSGPITDGCPYPGEDTSLILGCFTVRLADDLVSVEEIGSIAPVAPPVLLSTQVIQYLLAEVYNERDLHVGAPTITDVLWEAVSAEEYRMVLLLSGDLDEESVDRDSFGMRKLHAGGWDLPGTDAVRTDYEVRADGPALVVSIEDPEDVGFLEAGSRYHLYANLALNPVADERLRPLRPHAFVWRFGLSAGAGGLLDMHRL